MKYPAFDGMVVVQVLLFTRQDLLYNFVTDYSFAEIVFYLYFKLQLSECMFKADLVNRKHMVISTYELLKTSFKTVKGVSLRLKKV